MKALAFPFYPMMFALFCVVGAYRVVYLQVLPENLMLPCAVTILASVVLYGGTYLLVKDVHRAALTASMLLICFFSYGGFHEALKMAFASGGMEFNPLFGVIAYIIIAGLILVPFFQKERDWKIFTPALNIASLVLLLTNSIEPASHCNWVNQKLEQPVATIKANVQKLQVAPNAAKPDIYYIVLDAFGNPSSLKEFYDYDAGPFTDFLKQKGFYVAPNATSNYDRTMLSFASFLNLDYLDAIITDIDKKNQDYQVGYRLAQNGVYLRYLQEKLGYKLINLSSGYDPTNLMPSAQQNVGMGLGTAFFIGLMQLTLYHPLENQLHLLRSIYVGNRLLTFSKMKELVPIAGPKMVLAHCEFPHPPFVIDASGNPLPMSPKLMSESYDRSKYIGQLEYTVKEVEKLVEDLLSQPGEKPVIIIHSDHGPAMNGDKSTPQYARERMKVFLAVYLPDGKYDRFYDSMSLVNLGRESLNSLFGASLERLPDKSFVAPEGLPFDFVDITAKVSAPHPDKTR